MLQFVVLTYNLISCQSIEQNMPLDYKKVNSKLLSQICVNNEPKNKNKTKRQENETVS